VRRLPDSTRAERWAIGLCVLILGLYTAEVHHVFVDKGSHFPDQDNLSWQRELHNHVVARDPAVIPHSYRFLPDSLIAIFRVLVRGYPEATVLYRIVFQSLVIFALYVWAGLHLSRRHALIPPLLYAIVYPMSNVGYAGQATDPMSHLSFLLAFIFIERGQFRELAFTIGLGVLAKESVAAMAFFYPFMARSDPRRWSRAAILVALAIAVLLSVRLWIADGLEYKNVSGVGLEHLADNIVTDRRDWMHNLLYTVGVWLPLALWRWNEHPRTLRHLAVFLFCAIFASSAAFSWLRECRNFVPVVFVLTILATRRLASVLDPPAQA
jgi:hypothetical protein